jgi:hypothetical protein
LLDKFPLVEIVPEVVNLAETYFSKLQIPEKARLDAYHLAKRDLAWSGFFGFLELYPYC